MNSIIQTGSSSADPKKGLDQEAPEEKHACTAKWVFGVDPASGDLPQDLTFAIRDIYEPAGMKVTREAAREAESAEYGACRLGLNGCSVVFREAKTTPNKVGQFVTTWKRPKAITEPLDIKDGVDFLVVSVSDASHRGQFVFDQKILLERGIMSRSGHKGKTAFRVYPPWAKTVNRSAINTQNWQVRYFFPIDQNTGSADDELVRKLFKA